MRERSATPQRNARPAAPAKAGGNLRLHRASSSASSVVDAYWICETLSHIFHWQRDSIPAVQQVGNSSNTAGDEYNNVVSYSII